MGACLEKIVTLLQKNYRDVETKRITSIEIFQDALLVHAQTALKPQTNVTSIALYKNYLSFLPVISHRHLLKMVNFGTVKNR